MPLIQYMAGAASMAGAWFIHWPVRPVRGLHGPHVRQSYLKTFLWHSVLLTPCTGRVDTAPSSMWRGH